MTTMALITALNYRRNNQQC